MIRQWNRSDVPQIAAIEAGCFREPWSERALEESLASDSFELWVSEREGEVLAYAGFVRAADEAMAANIAVRSDARRKGLARELLEAVFESLKVRGFCAFTLEVRPSNLAAKALYASLGLALAGRRRGFYSDGEDAEIYTLRF